MFRALGMALLVGALAVIWWFDRTPETLRFDDPLPQFTLDARPAAGRYLLDYAGVLDHFAEGAQRYLSGIAQRYGVEVLIVSVPTLPDGHTMSTLAVDVFNRWRIGGEHAGRGLLLLLVDDAKAVRLEVGYRLEGTFTDAFSGYVEDQQLGPNYRDGDLGTGLIAVIEQIEARAQLHHAELATAGAVAAADERLLSGGAGAARRLDRYESGRPATAIAGARGHGAETPEAAWRLMLAQWGGEAGDDSRDVYTAITRRAMGAPTDPDPRTRASLAHWLHADYEVRSDGRHAVIWFGAKDGWDNAPFLFCNGGDGWKFDIVHQRRLVVMAEAPHWQIVQGPYPYSAMMPEARQTTSKDLPLAATDLYRCADDVETDARMTELERVLARDPDAVAATLGLLRLTVAVGSRPNRVRPLIDNARRLAPDAPDTYRYSAIYNANTFFQYETALDDVDRLLTLEPDSMFGRRMKGFLLYRLGRYESSNRELERAVELDAADAYSYALMARNFALLARDADSAEQRDYRDRASLMRDTAARVSRPGSQRISWLDRWLQGRV